MEGRTPSQEMTKSRFYTDQASREEMESGVVVYDKGRREVLMGLLMTGWLNTRKVRDEVTYQNTSVQRCLDHCCRLIDTHISYCRHGDKESFWMVRSLPLPSDIPKTKRTCVMLGLRTHRRTIRLLLDRLRAHDRPNHAPRHPRAFDQLPHLRRSHVPP